MGKAERSGNNREASNIQNALDMGRCTAERYYLPEAIGITVDDEDEYTLFSHYLTQRLLRAFLYNRVRFLSHPAASITGLESAITIGLSKIDKEYVELDKILHDVEAETAVFVEEHYSDKKEHARNVELAVNDLVARLTPTDSRGQVGLVFDNEQVAQWADRWNSMVATD